VTAAPALAHVVGSGSSLAVPASATPGQPFAATALFLLPSGATFPAGVPVIFSQESGPASACVARFSPEFANTDAAGFARTQAALPAGCPGGFVLVATAAGSGSVRATVIETGGGFPNTSAAPPGRPATPWWAVVRAAIMLLAGRGLDARWTSRPRGVRPAAPR